MQGKLIVIEGLDSSGKETQSRLLLDNLTKQGYNAKRFEFPNYKSESSALVKMYLSGQFGNDADSVGPYAASSFYAVDRYATWKKEMESFYTSGGVVIADRYTTSNIIHQAGKIKEQGKKEAYINWLYDFEFEKLELPKPDEVIFLHMPVEVSVKLMENRRNKAGTAEKDIHEANYDYLKYTYANAMDMINYLGYKKVECCSGENVRSIEEIQRDILNIVEKIL